MSKLSTPQIQALHEINAKVAVDLITAKSVTITSLDKRGLIYKGTYIGGVPAWYLTEDGKEAIGLSDRVEDVIVEEDKVDEILTELSTTPWDEEAPTIPFFNRKARRAVRQNSKRFNRKHMREHGKRTRKYGDNVLIRHLAA